MSLVLSKDPWGLWRTVEADDGDGIVRTQTVEVAAGRGAFGYKSMRERAWAAQAGTEVDASLSTHTPARVFQIGDAMLVRGEWFRIVGIKAPITFGARLALKSIPRPNGTGVAAKVPEAA